MHIRPTGHQTKVDNQSTELGEHFSKCGMDQMSLQIIDCVKMGEDEKLSCLEGFWQNMLATFQVNNGNINIRNKWKYHMGQQPYFLTAGPEVLW